MDHIGSRPAPRGYPRRGWDRRWDGAEEPDYFFGTILLLDGAGGDLPKAREREPRLFEIIDGQQRLVTLAMIAAVLRDLGTERWRWGSRNRLDQLIVADAAPPSSTV